MKKIGFFGGCFNPPTNTHIKLANNLIKEGKLDKVVFVPVGDYYQKQDLVSAKHRLNMLKLTCDGFENIEIEEIAVASIKKLFASDTFKLIYDKYNKDSEIYFIMGSDNFNKMPKWKDYDKIKEKYKYIILERTEDISSTEIRNKIRCREDVSQYIKNEVLRYIKENKLYIWISFKKKLKAFLLYERLENAWNIKKIMVKFT